MDNFPEDSSVLLLFLNEISTIEEKSNHANTSSTMRPCDINDQMFITGTGLTQGGAESDLEAGQEKALKSGALDGCTALDREPRIYEYGIFITATISYCCDGHGGATGSW